MGLKIRMTVKCDGCGKIIVRSSDVKITEVQSQWWRWRRFTEPPLMMVRERFRRASLTYCPGCADGTAA